MGQEVEVLLWKPTLLGTSYRVRFLHGHTVDSRWNCSRSEPLLLSLHSKQCPFQSEETALAAAAPGQRRLGPSTHRRTSRTTRLQGLGRHHLPHIGHSRDASAAATWSPFISPEALALQKNLNSTKISTSEESVRTCLFGQRGHPGRRGEGEAQELCRERAFPRQREVRLRG